MGDCRTCKHNTYRDLKDCNFVSCGHPITLAKTPRPEAGDPAWVSAMTADIKIAHMESLSLLECEAWETLPSTANLLRSSLVSAT